MASAGRGYFFPDIRRIFSKPSQPPIPGIATLSPAGENSVNFDETKNRFIESDKPEMPVNAGE